MVVAAEAKTPDEFALVTRRADVSELVLGAYNRPQAWTKDPVLSDFGALKLLVLWASRLKTAGLVKGLQLQSLYLSGNDTLVDIKALATQTELEALLLGSKVLLDFSPLQDLPLQWFVAKGSRLKDWGSLPLSTLRFVDISGSRVGEIPRREAPELEYLAMTSTRIKSLDGIESMPQLRRFHAWKNKKLTHVDAILACRHLNILNLNRTGVDAESALRLLDLPDLGILACAKTPAADSDQVRALRDKAKQQKVKLCLKESEFARAHSFELRDVEYYLRVHQGAESALADQSALGYACSYRAFQAASSNAASSAKDED